MSKRMAARGATCRTACLRRRSLPSSQGAPQASLPPPLGVHAGERPSPGNNVPGPADGPVKQERLLADENKN